MEYLPRRKKYMTSYDVKALFTSVTVDPFIYIVQKIITGSHIKSKDQHVNPKLSHPSGVLPLKHLLPLPR